MPKRGGCPRRPAGEHQVHQSVGVIGAGVAGVACARTLQNAGRGVALFDRGRGPGGRLSTRRAPIDDDLTIHFDHGAPAFSAASARFSAIVDDWIELGLCARWRPRRAVWRADALHAIENEPALIVGVPTMGAICRRLAEGLDIRSGANVELLERIDGGWLVRMTDSDGQASAHGPFVCVVVAAPPPQALPLIALHAGELAEQLTKIEMRTTWALMLRIEDPTPEAPDMIEIEGDPVIERIIRDDAKPGRTPDQGHSRWVVHATHAWSAARRDHSQRQIVDELAPASLALLGRLAGRPIDPAQTRHAAAHRWGAARPMNPLSADCLFDRELGLGVCGDCFEPHAGASGVEAAHLSGLATSERLLKCLEA
ncbi:MAG: hypothetical protein EA376_14710 [Phycisphaeraceae bacterium]|nr:MAG: hypothetical protein EA376_14710 [Phycisphaeraceae bacterium]